MLDVTAVQSVPDVEHRAALNCIYAKDASFYNRTAYCRHPGGTLSDIYGEDATLTSPIHTWWVRKTNHELLSLWLPY